MVAVIKTGYAIQRTFHYNENKIDQGVARCLLAANYPLELVDITKQQRLNMLLKTAALNPDVMRNSVHITLNFAPGEELSDAKLKAIATEYMERIGFSAQPFLVYKHMDAGHPHIHIATVKIKPDGSKIDMQNIGKNQSETARKALEEKYNLIKAEDHKKQLFTIKPIDVQKVIYGVSETKRAIGNVLEHVLGKYKYGSLTELNAVLGIYNVLAERGSERSRTYKNRGLVYRIIDESGNPIGVSIKASLFHNKPTLPYLEKQFLSNDIARQPLKVKLKSQIDFIIKSKRPDTLERFIEVLQKEGIKVITRTANDGQLYGLTYLDMKNKCAFNGSDLGKDYAAKGILERLATTNKKPSEQIVIPSKIIGQALPQQKVSPLEDTPLLQHNSAAKSLLEELLEHEYTSQSIPFEWKKKKKKRKKR